MERLSVENCAADLESLYILVVNIFSLISVLNNFLRHSVEITSFLSDKFK